MELGIGSAYVVEGPGAQHDDGGAAEEGDSGGVDGRGDATRPFRRPPGLENAQQQVEVGPQKEGS